MPLNLRIATRFARDATLARRLEAALATLEAELPPEEPVKPARTAIGRWLQRLGQVGEPWEPTVMGRSWIRHPRAYKIKFWLSTGLQSLGVISGAELLWLVPLFWLFGHRSGLWRQHRRIYLARCDFLDIGDEIERRLRARRAK